MFYFKPITIKDKTIFNKFLNPYNFLSSEYSFTNLFIWRKSLNIEYCIINNTLIIKKNDFNKKSHFMEPLGYKKENLKELLDQLIKYKQENNLDYLFKDLTYSFVKDIISIYKNSIEIKEDRANADYIYLKENLATLKGKKLHNKRNHYNFFIKNYQYKISPINQSITSNCLYLADKWCEEHGCTGSMLDEFYGIKDLLKNMESLNLLGMAVYINNKIVGFTIGEKISSSLGIIHIEKAYSSIRGVYTYINKTFIENYLNDVTYINREQDLGISGLRKAKLSYNPLKLEMKYFIK